MKLAKFYVDVFPGYDPKHLYASTANTEPLKIEGSKRFSFEVLLPAPDEFYPAEHTKAGNVEEVPSET